MISVAIVDDDELVCTYLRRMLSATGTGVTVVGHAHGLDEAGDLLDRTHPDVVLLDLRLGRDDGLRLLGDESAHPRSRILVLTGYPDDAAVLRALRDGATGFLTKSTSPRQLVSAVHLVADGHRVLGSGLPGLEAATPGASDERGRVEGVLSGREIEVLRRLGLGMSNVDIAAELGLGEGTIKGHVSRMLQKLDCDSRLQAGLLAQRLGL